MRTNNPDVDIQQLLTASSNTLLYDTFTDTDGTDVSSHTPDVGGPWVNFGGSNAKILSNQAIGDIGVADAQGQYADVGHSDYTVTVNWINGQGFNWPVVLLRLDSSNGTGYYLVNEGTTNVIALYEYDGGSYSQVAAASVSLTGTDLFDIVLLGADLNVSVNGVLTLTYNSMTRNPASTKVGFSLYDQAHNATAAIDAYLVSG